MIQRVFEVLLGPLDRALRHRGGGFSERAGREIRARVFGVLKRDPGRSERHIRQRGGRRSRTRQQFGELLLLQQQAELGLLDLEFQHGRVEARKYLTGCDLVADGDRNARDGPRGAEAQQLVLRPCGGAGERDGACELAHRGLDRLRHGNDIGLAALQRDIGDGCRGERPRKRRPPEPSPPRAAALDQRVEIEVPCRHAASLRTGIEVGRRSG